MSARPDLDTIFAHPFFTHDPKKIPRSLPSCCTHVAPDWQEDHDGYLVPVLAEAEEHENHPLPSSSKIISHHSNIATKQHPLNGKDNGNQIISSKNKFEIYSETPSQRTAITSKLDRQKSSGSSSRIKPVDRQFRQGSEDEAPSQNPQRNDSLLENMRKMAIGKSDESPPSKTRSSESPAGIDDDARALQSIYTRLQEFGLYLESNKVPVSSRAASPVDTGRAEKWVTRYVDYTSKYGLGFLFNDGR